MNFWQKLKKPFFCLAPMSDVTDVAFRYLLAKYGKVESTRQNKNSSRAGKSQIVFWTEFVSADGLCHPLGRKKLMHILKFSKIEKPIVAQVFGANPVNMEKACRLISKLGFAGIDLNMGCPDKSVIRQGAGSALIRTPALAREIIQSAIRGAGALPVSVKTRVGFNREEIDTWIPELLKENISALTIHARTKKEMSNVPANWAYVKRVVDLVKKSGKGIPVIGNGDVQSLSEAKQKAKETGCDGVMIGRGVFGKPWFFSDTKNLSRHQNDTLSLEKERARGNILIKGKIKTLDHLPSQTWYSSLEKEEIQWILLRIKTLVEHIKLFDKKLLKTGDKSYAVMKKHFKAYINGWEGAKDLRAKLMLTETPKESISILTTFQKILK